MEIEIGCWSRLHSAACDWQTRGQGLLAPTVAAAGAQLPSAQLPMRPPPTLHFLFQHSLGRCTNCEISAWLGILVLAFRL